MLFEDQIEQASEYFSGLSERVNENPSVISLKERFSNLSGFTQKLLLGCFIAIVLFLLISSPLSWYKDSVANMQDYEARQSLTQKVIQTAKTSKSLSKKPKYFSASELSASVSNLNNSPSIAILPEQSSVRPSGTPQNPIPSAKIQGFTIQNKNVNIKQALTLAYSLKRLNQSLYIDGIEFRASEDKPDYFNAQIYVANLYTPSIQEILPKPDPIKTNQKRRGRGK